MRLRPRLKKNGDLFANLPSDIIIEILSRLPIRTIISCKCVCKSWLALIEARDFASSHLLKAAVGLALNDCIQRSYTIYEFEDLENNERYGVSVIKFNLPFERGWIGGSANGLLLQCSVGKCLTLYICNPITRDYIKIHRPRETLLSPCRRLLARGFGVSKRSGKHKVVTIFEDNDAKNILLGIPASYVYTIGTGGWKKIAPPAGNLNGCRNCGVFLNGNLHWLVSDLKTWISCFDLENELFSTFLSPLVVGSSTVGVELCALGDTLCLHVNGLDRIDIWLMKEYGVEKSWTKQFVISKNPGMDRYYIIYFYPIKVFNDGDSLIAWRSTHHRLFYYSKKNKTVQNSRMFSSSSGIFLYTPSFLSLKSFEREDVRSF